MAIDKKFTYIAFSRIKDLLEFPLPDKLREITYVANCTNFRRLLLNKYGRPDIDIDKEITQNPDTKLTYLGYRKFLESDLKHIFALGENRGSNQYKRDVKYVAKEMLARGYVSFVLHLIFNPSVRLTLHIGLCRSCEERVSKSSETVDPRVNWRTQGLDKPFEHTEWIYHTVALQCGYASGRRVDKRPHGRVPEGPSFRARLREW
jgi:hypothetical protein